VLDVKSVTELVEKEVTSSVNQYVTAILNDQAWQMQIEKRITDFVKERIAAKFVNVSAIPGLVDTVQASIKSLFDNGQVPGIDQYVNHNTIIQGVDSAIQNLIKDTIGNLTLDKNWVTKIETMVNQEMSQRLLTKLSGIDINSVIVNELEGGIDRWQERMLSKFRTNGITDIAKSCQLTIMDGAVVIANGATAKNALIEENLEVKGSLIVNNLVVKKLVNTDSQSWNELTDVVANKTKEKLTADWKQQLVADVLDIAKTDGISFDKVSLDGELLIDGNKLNSKITNTSIQKLGRLEDLTVDGTTRLNETMTVKRKRIGINTDDPEMALSVWDEEVSLIAGKLSKDLAYIGTARKQALSLGINRMQSLKIDEEGQVTIKKLRVDRWQISHAAEVPGWTGTRGDFVLNSDPKPDSPFAWVCLGGFRWQALRSSE
jgi:hypothetical protein